MPTRKRRTPKRRSKTSQCAAHIGRLGGLATARKRRRGKR